MPEAANPFAPPQARVADIALDGEPQPIRLWPPRGRLGRLRYLAYNTVAWLALMVLMGLAGGLSAVVQSASLIVVISVIAYSAFIVVNTLLTIQRCHDINWSGWLAVLMIVPVVNFLFLLVPGTRAANRFGAPTQPNTLSVKVWATMALVFIIGILAAVALPAYQGYTLKARAAQGR